MQVLRSCRMLPAHRTSATRHQRAVAEVQARWPNCGIRIGAQKCAAQLLCFPRFFHVGPRSIVTFRFMYLLNFYTGLGFQVRL